jgi:hypothetical protein
LLVVFVHEYKQTRGTRTNTETRRDRPNVP